MSELRTWEKSWQPAMLGEELSDGRVRCTLSPRNCIIKEGRNGFCGVRGNRNGQLVTMNYGKSVHMTQETIETEAVNHFAPGEPILSLGNIGCMLNCVYCHNWKTSQARYVSDRDVYYYTPEDVIAAAKRHGIRVISWTYNDPVVWHEFVIETSKLAKQEGIITLYKSAFYIDQRAVEQLLPVIDIFSISIKAIDPGYYKKYTTGRLEPVLAATKQVFEAGKHVEVSNLMITGISDNDQTAAQVSEWVLRDLNAKVPVHFVRFHPDYKMRDSTRTPIPNLISARKVALEHGIEQVYLGNVYDTRFSNTYCRHCGNILVERFGLTARSVGLNDAAKCIRCGTDSNIVMLSQREPALTVDTIKSNSLKTLPTVDWHGDINSVHVQVKNTADFVANVYTRRRYENGARSKWEVTPLMGGESYRFIVAKSEHNEVGPEIQVDSSVVSLQAEVFDRAHFPTVDIEDAGISESDVTPMPVFAGNQMK